MAAKKRRSLISGTPRSVARAGEAGGEDFGPDGATDEFARSDASETSETSEESHSTEGAMGSLRSIADRTDRFPQMARPESTTEEDAPRLVGAAAEAPAVLPTQLEEPDPWFVRTGAPVPRRDEPGSQDAVVVRTSVVGQWVFAFVVAVGIALFVTAIVWVVAS